MAIGFSKESVLVRPCDIRARQTHYIMIEILNPLLTRTPEHRVVIYYHCISLSTQPSLSRFSIYQENGEPVKTFE